MLQGHVAKVMTKTQTVISLALDLLLASKNLIFYLMQVFIVFTIREKGKFVSFSIPWTCCSGD